MLAQLAERLGRGFELSADYGEAKVQLAVVYYWTKAVRAAKAAATIAATGDTTEALILLRSLFNLVVDCLWMNLDPVARAALFYDATALGFERQRETLAAAGVTFGSEVAEAIDHNRAHFEQAAGQFRRARGDYRAHWAPGTLPERVREIERTDSDMAGLSDLYTLLYKTLSLYEHSAPTLCFQYVSINERRLSPAPNPSPFTPQKFGEALGVLLGALVSKTMQHLGVRPEEIAGR